jgi:hypothetical protein
MSDKMLREALEEGRDLFIDYACEGNENTPLEPLRSWLDKSAAALCATPPEGGRILFDPSDHTSPSLPAKEERRCKCGHTRLDHYPDSPCAICACEVYRPAPQPAATGQDGPCSQMNRDLLWDAAHYQQALEVVQELVNAATGFYEICNKQYGITCLDLSLAIDSAEAILKEGEK